MKNNTLTDFTQHVLSTYQGIENPRTRLLVEQLIQHLHAYAIETQLTTQEWESIWTLLENLAAYTHPKRNEFLLGADVLGLSQLIELLNHQRTDYALVGPFYRANVPLYPCGQCIVSDDTAGERLYVRGKVVQGEKKTPIAGAMLDVWGTAPNGLYESQDPNQPDMNLRGRFKTDENGHFDFITIMATAYPVPTDGPVGELLKLAKRHPYRPAHIHFIVSAPNFETLITQMFVANDPLVDTDVVFTANHSMLGNFYEKEGKHFLEQDFYLTPGISTYPKAPIA